MGADAKIDLEKVWILTLAVDVLTLFQNIIEINRPALPVHQTIIEKTRGVALRTQALGAALARPVVSAKAAEAPGAIPPTSVSITVM